MQENFMQYRVYLTGVSAKTLVWYKNAFRQFDGALESKASLIGRIAQLKERGTSHITINSYLRVINAYFMWLHKEHGKELIHIPKLKEEQKVVATLSAVQVQKVMSAKVTGTNLVRAQLMAVLMLDTGLRASEVLGLTKADVDFENSILKVKGKGGKHRLVPFSQELRKRLFRHVQKFPHSLLFGTSCQTEVSIHNLDRDFKELGKTIGITGIRFSPHTMRHSFSVIYLRNGGNLEFLRRILGHSSLVTTQKYLKSLGVEDLEAVHSHLSPLAKR